MARPLIRTFGKRHGECNICGNHGQLTEDHSPPKSCVRPTAVQIRHIVGLLADEGVEEKGRISQNGLKFRTLCAHCNNELLGRRYDPAMAEFSERVSDILSSSLRLPNTIDVRCRPQLIARAVFGHLAAQGVERYLKGPHTEVLRDAFLDSTVPFPRGVRFYYWPFPYRGCVLIRDAAFMNLPTKNVAIIWLMKFFPVSFMIAWEQTEDPMFTVPSLSQWMKIAAGDVIEIPIPLKPIPHRYWPEAPSKTSIVIYGQEAMFAVPHITQSLGMRLIG